MPLLQGTSGSGDAAWTNAITSAITTTDGVASGTARVVGGRAFVNNAVSTTVTNVQLAYDTSLFTIPIATLKANTKLKWKAVIGCTATAGAGATLLVQAFFDGVAGTLIADSTTMAIGGAAGNGVNGLAIIEGELAVRADASAGAGTMSGFMTSKFATVGAAYTVDTLDVAGGAAGTYTVAVDNSAAVTFSLAGTTEAGGTTTAMQYFEAYLVG